MQLAAPMSLVADNFLVAHAGGGGGEGLTVLDLGSGSGRDCYIAAKLVGHKGRVIGVDMTEEQLAVSRKHAEAYCREALEYPGNILEFRKGSQLRRHPFFCRHSRTFL